MIERPQSIVRSSRPDLSIGSASIERRFVGQQQLSIADVWRMLAKRKFSILVFAALVFGLAAAYTFLKTPLYEGVARLQIDPSRSSSLGLDESEKSAPTDVDSRVKTEVAIIQSDTVAMRVIKSLELYSKKEFAGKDVVLGEVKDVEQLTATQRRRLLDRFSGALTVKV